MYNVPSSIRSSCRRGLITAVVALALLALSPRAAAQCSAKDAPRVNRPSDVPAYRNWCQSCGGAFSYDGKSMSSIKCTPGPSWGRKAGAPDPQPSNDREAQRQRDEAERERQEEEQLQRQEEERQRKEAEEAKRRQEEFERNKQEALRGMKAIGEGLGAGDTGGLKGLDETATRSIGLKGIGDNGPEEGLKDALISVVKPPKKTPGCTWGDMGGNVVDLRCLGLDPDKPIVIDPHVVRGEQRVFPAQINPETFKNQNYNNGFAALTRPPFAVRDAVDAVGYFKQALAERPDDPLVRNALALGESVMKWRLQKEKDDRAKVAELLDQIHAALMSWNFGSARAFITRARAIDPNNANLQFLDSLTAVIGPESDRALTSERRTAYKLVANTLVSISKQDDQAAVALLEVARGLQPQDKFIGTLLLTMRNYVAGRAAANPQTDK